MNAFKITDYMMNIIVIMDITHKFAYISFYYSAFEHCLRIQCIMYFFMYNLLNNLFASSSLNQKQKIVY